jgi:hypothetical protein
LRIGELALTGLCGWRSALGQARPSRACEAEPSAKHQAGIRADDGSVIAFPYLSHPRAGLSHAEWRALSPSEKIELLLDMSLDRAAEILTWPVAELDPLRASLRMQVWRIVFMIGMKAMLEGKLGRERDRERALEKLSLGLRARLRDDAAPET